MREMGEGEGVGKNREALEAEVDIRAFEDPPAADSTSTSFCWLPFGAGASPSLGGNRRVRLEEEEEEDAPFALPALLVGGETGAAAALVVAEGEVAGLMLEAKSVELLLERLLGTCCCLPPPFPPPPPAFSAPPPPPSEAKEVLEGEG